MAFSFSPFWETAVLAAAPFIEPRAAIPIGVFALGLSPLQAGIAGFAGGLFPVFVAAPILYRIGARLAQRFPFVAAALNRVAARHHAKLSRAYAPGLVVLSALPVPILGGVWTAVAASFAISLPLRRVFVYCTIGNFIGNALIVVLTFGIAALVRI